MKCFHLLSTSSSVLFGSSNPSLPFRLLAASPHPEASRGTQLTHLTIETKNKRLATFNDSFGLIRIYLFHSITNWVKLFHVSHACALWVRPETQCGAFLSPWLCSPSLAILPSLVRRTCKHLELVLMIGKTVRAAPLYRLTTEMENMKM